MKIFSVHDNALDAYMRPFFAPTAGAAIRSFSDEVNNKESPMAAHPADYDLYQLGDWDENTAKFETHQPEQIARAQNLTREK